MSVPHQAGPEFLLERAVDVHDPLAMRLVLRDPQDLKMSPLAVDFLDPKIIYRLKNGLGKNQLLPKALGLRTQQANCFVLDLTAGLGVDAFFMAAYGCRVLAVERNEIVYRLLADGFVRLKEASQRGQFAEIALSAIAARLTFVHVDARDLMRDLESSQAGIDRPDVIYFDPMYPDEGRSDSALPKKAMQIFRRLIGDDHDSESVAQQALVCAKSRLVIKRPLRAPPLLSKPSHSYSGKTARYDMYLTNV